MDKDTYNDNFYMTLSNSDSINYYPKNKPSNFTVQFDKNIELLRKMEVALVETIFSKLNTTVKLIIYDASNYKFDIRLNLTLFEIKNIASLFDILKENISKFTEFMVIDKMVKKLTGRDGTGVYNQFELIQIIMPTFYFNYKTKTFRMRSGILKAKLYQPNQWDEITWYLYFEFDDKLNSIIRFPSFSRETNSYYSENVPLNMDIINHLYIYLDILTPSITGNTKSNLLRIISRSNELRDSNSIEFNNKIFIPVNRQLIESITVTIKNKKGNLINFIVIK